VTTKAPPGPIGSAAEDRALRLLLAQGLTLVGRNFRCRVGEIDLIMRDGQVVVFVEVRYRSDHRRGSAAETVSLQKQRRFTAAARRYLQQHPAAARAPCRFDVVAITGEQVDWLKGAFAAAG
jgi:putative endonuclease